MHHYTAIAEQIILKEKVFDVYKPGHGNVDDPWLVATDINDETNFILQRIHTRFGKQPKLNMRTVSSFRDHRRRPAGEESRRWLMPVEPQATPSIGSRKT